MFGALGNKLTLEAKRLTKLSELPQYQSDLVRDIVKETNDLNEDAEFLTEQQRQQELNPSNEEELKVNQCQLFVTHLHMRRNKRCLLAYERTRANKIDEFCWLNIDPVVDTDSAPDKLANNTDSTPPVLEVPVDGSVTRLGLNNLSHAEEEYLKSYQRILVNYKSHFADLDLSGSLEPPSNIFIDVRVLKDGNEVQTEYGVFNLIKDSQFYVRKSDVERLIQQGYLEEI